MPKPFFSIIVPVYNAEKYLKKCIHHIIEQGFSNYELILIDDGSTDSSSLILHEYESYDNVHVIRQTNKGVSIARNKGLEEAKGKYIMFVDADDILYSNALSILYNFLNKKAVDYLRYEYQTINENELPLYPNYEAKIRKKIATQIFNSPDCITKIIRNEFFLWSGVFKKEIIDKKHLRFMERCTYNEDTLFMIQYFTYSISHSYIPIILYEYRKSKEAVTSRFTEKNYQDVKEVAQKLCEIYTTTKQTQMQQAIKSVIEVLYLRIINIAQTKNESHQMIIFCCNHPIKYEWKIIKLLGYTVSKKCITFIQLMQRIIRKLY